MQIRGVDLSVDFCGLKFPNPFVLSSAPPTTDGAMIKRAFSMGWGGAITKTLGLPNLEIVNTTPRLGTIRGFRGDLIGLENIELITDRPLDVWLEEIKEVKKEYPENILIASLMTAAVKEDWQELVRLVQATGVDAFELNFSCPHGMPEKGIGAAIGQDPEIASTITRWVKEVAEIPVIVKLTPNVTNIGVVAKAVEAAGADAISAINTVSVLIGIDVEKMEPIPTVDGKSSFGGYSGPAVRPIGLRCVAEIAQATKLPVSGIGGISTWENAVEYMLVGASTVQLCTAVMFEGYRIIYDLVDGLADYVERHGFKKVQEIVGLALPKLSAHEKLSRKYKVVANVNPDLCIKDDLCARVCQDAGYSAIQIGADRVAKVDDEKCHGCSLCQQVCPVWGCIQMKVVEGGSPCRG